MELSKSWHRAWSNLCITVDSEIHTTGERLFTELCSYYRLPDRHYHTLQHLQECLDLFEPVMSLATHPAEVEMALWFHDAIYNPTSPDNEAQSAQWASNELSKAGVLPEKIARIHALIMATCHTALPQTIDECLLVDIDLAILAAPVARFAEYEQQILAEYHFVPEPIFNQKRQEILQGFLDRSSCGDALRTTIYSTEYFQGKLELRARDNIRRSILTKYHKRAYE